MMTIRHLGLILLTGCLCLPLTAGIRLGKPASATRVALLIGNSNYEGAPKLANAAKDARDVAEVLKACGFSVILACDATREKMDESILMFGKILERAEVGLFYYAGHGLQLEGVNYLVPLDVVVEKAFQVRSRCVMADEVLMAMADARTRTNLIFLDACRDNPFGKIMGQEFRGLAKMNAPKRSMVVFATAPGEVAADGEGSNGLFTSSLLKYLPEKGLEIHEMLRLVRQEVMKLSRDRQAPWSQSSLTESFVFATSDQSGHHAGSDMTGLAVRREAEAAQKKPEPGQAFQCPELGLEIVPIAAGVYAVGASSEDTDERPEHKIKLQHHYWIGRCEVTQEQYQSLMGKNPAKQVGAKHPVENLTWEEAVQFCKKLSERENAAGRCPAGYEYRLPTEMEWEVACRVGKQELDTGHLEQRAWTKENSENKHHAVGELEANAWGIYDMQGNVWEWVIDAYNKQAYRPDRTDPVELKGRTRVVRGGSWYDSRSVCRPSNRDHYEPDVAGDVLGFRVVLAPSLSGL